MTGDTQHFAAASGDFEAIRQDRRVHQFTDISGELRAVVESRSSEIVLSIGSSDPLFE